MSGFSQHAHQSWIDEGRLPPLPGGPWLVSSLRVSAWKKEEPLRETWRRALVERATGFMESPPTSSSTRSHGRRYVERWTPRP